MTQYVKKRFDTAPQGCEACPRPSSPVFRPVPPPDQSKAGKKQCPPILRRVWAALWSATLRRASTDFCGGVLLFCDTGKLAGLAAGGTVLFSLFFFICGRFASKQKERSPKPLRLRAS